MLVGVGGANFCDRRLRDVATAELEVMGKLDMVVSVAVSLRPESEGVNPVVDDLDLSFRQLDASDLTEDDVFEEDSTSSPTAECFIATTEPVRPTSEPSFLTRA